MKKSLNWRIAFNMWILAGVSAFLSVIFTFLILWRSYDNSIEQQLQGTATHLISVGISNYAALEHFEEIDVFLIENLDLEKINQVIQVFNPRGKLLFGAPAEANPAFSKIFVPTKKPVFRMHDFGGRTYKILTAPYESKNGQDFFLQISIPYPKLHQVMISVVTLGSVVFILLSALSFIISHYLVKRLTAPVKSVADYLNTLEPASAKDWPLLATTQEGDYLADIVNGVNTLARRVKGALYGMSRMSRYLAHELRNPLTILRGEAEIFLTAPQATVEEARDVLKSSLDEIDRMTNVVSTVTRIFKKEKADYRPVPCNVGIALDEWIVKWDKFLESEITWNKSSSTLVIVLEVDLLFQLLDNLIRNIKFHTPIGTKAAITLSQRDEGALIIVEDNGQGLPDDMIEALNSKNSSHEKISIGLSLCLEIATICNFKLHFENKPAGGLLVTVAV